MMGWWMKGGMSVLEEFTCGLGACERVADVICVDGVRTLDSCVAGTPIGENCESGVDNDCDGVVDEGSTFQFGGGDIDLAHSSRWIHQIM